MYYKRVPMNLEEAVMFEAAKGFECRDEFYEVMSEIAELYDVEFADVLEVFYNSDTEVV